MKVQLKEMTEQYVKSLENKNLIISGLDFKPEYINKKDNKTTPARFYVKTVFEEDYMPAFEVKITEQLFNKIRTQKLINSTIKLTDFTDLNFGVTVATQYNLTLWFSATDLTTNQSFTPKQN
jgi:hypothetical protein